MTLLFLKLSYGVGVNFNADKWLFYLLIFQTLTKLTPTPQT